MKLIIQIPCLDEEDQLPATIADLPVEVPGFDEVEYLVVDDGSTDRTVEVARGLGVHHVVKLTNNKGLAYAFQAGLDASLKLGADVVVNTDADNQYAASDIATLVGPIVDGCADMVIGDRDVMSIEHFSVVKKRLQRLGSWVLRRASDTEVPDATSGFRAYNREAALRLTVVSKFTYTLESLIQAGKSLVAVTHVPVATNPKTRESRLFPSMWTYIRRNVAAIFRIYTGYEPLRVFSILAAVLTLTGVLAWTPFLWDWAVHSDRSGHLQSIFLGGVLLLAAVQVFALGVIADLVAANREVTQRALERVRRIELQLGVPPAHYQPGPAGGPSRRPGGDGPAGPNGGAPDDRGPNGHDAVPDLGDASRPPSAAPEAGREPGPVAGGPTAERHVSTW
ncbi:MAG TPA: glycosyltransferase family 2 protein [Acidimicrobiales bacterium]|nr:glycosyltransferase family 2 protein [Acidimicrobiales bacterium]